jgi:hypothetical protein
MESKTQKIVSSFMGAAIVGAMAFGIWPEMLKSYGIMGGWITAAIVIGIAWYFNHWLGVINNPEGRIWVDQGWPIGAAGIAWALVRFKGGFAEFLSAMPVLVLCVIGGALAGLCVWFISKTTDKGN